jgi:hypothetical protein
MENTCLELGGDRVLVHVDVVLVDGSHHELVTLRLHPGGHERSQVQPWVPIQHELVVDDLVRRLLRDRVIRHSEPETIIYIYRQSRVLGREIRSNTTLLFKTFVYEWSLTITESKNQLTQKKEEKELNGTIRYD